MAAALLAAAGCTSIAVDARTLAGTKWRVAVIDGRVTPYSDRFRMSFDRQNFSVRFGCNSGGGHYRIAGSNLVPVGPVIATQMACAPIGDGQANPMDFERRAFAVTGKPMRMLWLGGNRLKLLNSAGSIELHRLR